MEKKNEIIPVENEVENKTTDKIEDKDKDDKVEETTETQVEEQAKKEKVYWPELLARYKENIKSSNNFYDTVKWSKIWIVLLAIVFSIAWVLTYSFKYGFIALIFAIAIYIYMYKKNIYDDTKNILEIILDNLDNIRIIAQHDIKLVQESKEELLSVIKHYEKELKEDLNNLKSIWIYSTKFELIWKWVSNWNQTANFLEKILNKEEAYPKEYKTVVKHIIQDPITFKWKRYEFNDSYNTNTLTTEEIEKIEHASSYIEDIINLMKKHNISISNNFDINVPNIITYVNDIIIDLWATIAYIDDYNELLELNEKAVNAIFSGWDKFNTVYIKNILVLDDKINNLKWWKWMDAIVNKANEISWILLGLLTDGYNYEEGIKKEIEDIYSDFIILLQEIAIVYKGINEENIWLNYSAKINKFYNEKVKKWDIFYKKFKELKWLIKKYEIYWEIINKDLYLNIDKYIDVIKKLEDENNTILDVKNISWDEFKMLVDNKDRIFKKMKVINEFVGYINKAWNQISSFKELSERLVTDISDIEINILSTDFTAILSTIKRDKKWMEISADKLGNIIYKTDNNPVVTNNWRERVRSAVASAVNGYVDLPNWQLDRSDVIGYRKKLKEMAEMYWKIIETLEDTKQKAQRIKSLQTNWLVDKIYNLQQQYSEAKSIVDNYQWVNSISAQSAITYLDELETQVNHNWFKHTLESLINITNGMWWPHWINKMLNDINKWIETYNDVRSQLG